MHDLIQYGLLSPLTNERSKYKGQGPISPLGLGRQCSACVCAPVQVSTLLHKTSPVCQEYIMLHHHWHVAMVTHLILRKHSMLGQVIMQVTTCERGREEGEERRGEGGGREEREGREGGGRRER